jgi:hypothetical protein
MLPIEPYLGLGMFLIGNFTVDGQSSLCFIWTLDFFLIWDFIGGLAKQNSTTKT